MRENCAKIKMQKNGWQIQIFQKITKIRNEKKKKKKSIAV